MQDTWLFAIPAWHRKGGTIATLLCLVLFSPALLLSAEGKDTKMLDVTELDIQSNTFGSGTLYIRPDGIKWNVNRHNFYFAAYAPGWQLMLYNTRNKMGRKQEYSKWTDLESMREPMKVLSVRSKPGLFLGLPARRVFMQVEPLDSFSSKAELMYQDAQDRSRAFTSVEILESAWLKLKPEQISFVRHVVGNPQVGGVVLKQENVFPSGKREKIIDTLALRNGKISSEDWVYPVKFKPASMSDIQEEKQRGREAAEMLGTLLLDKPAESAGTKSSAVKSNKLPATSAPKSKH